jgi:hypothetical protein
MTISRGMTFASVPLYRNLAFAQKNAPTTMP